MPSRFHFKKFHVNTRTYTHTPMALGVQAGPVCNCSFVHALIKHILQTHRPVRRNPRPHQQGGRHLGDRACPGPQGRRPRPGRAAWARWRVPGPAVLLRRSPRAPACPGPSAGLGARPMRATSLSRPIALQTDSGRSPSRGPDEEEVS